MKPIGLSVGQFIRSGWEIFKKRPAFLIGVQLAVYGAGYLLNLLVSAAQIGFGFVHHPITGAVIAFVVVLLLQVVVSLCMTAFSIKAHDSIVEAKFEDIWRPNRLWKYLGASILFYGAVIAGFILFIVPGIYAGLTFMFAPIIAVDKGLSPMEAMRESARITKNNKLRLLAFGLGICLVYAAGMLALLVGIIAAIPVAKLAIVNAYRRLTANADAQEGRVPLSYGEKWLMAIYVLYIVAFVCFMIFFFTHLGKFKPLVADVIVYQSAQTVSSVAPIDAKRVPMTAFSLQNLSTTSITIVSIGVEAGGNLQNPDAIEDVELVGNGMQQIGTSTRLDISGHATIPGPITLPPMSTSTYLVAADIAACDKACQEDGHEIQIAVISINTPATVGGNLPIVGGMQYINKSLKIATVTAKPAVVTNVPNSLNSGSDTKFISTIFTAGFQEDLNLQSVRYKYIGTLDFTKLSNVQATVNGKNTTAITSLDGEYWTVIFPTPIPLTEGSSLTVMLHGTADTTNAHGKTVEFDIEKPADAYFTGQTYGYGIAPSATMASSSSAWMLGSKFSL